MKRFFLFSFQSVSNTVFFLHDDDTACGEPLTCKKILYGEQTNNKVPSKYHRNTQKSDTLEREDRLFDLMGSHEKFRNFDVKGEVHQVYCGTRNC